MRFIKMHGIGNDYVYVNCFEESVDEPDVLAPSISDRHTGVGGDGLILLLPPAQGVDADVRMRMFNADGSESEMCGNGIRCLCKLAHDHGVCRENPMRVKTGNGVLSLEYTTDADARVDDVTVDMGEPILTISDIPVDPDQLTPTARPQTFAIQPDGCGDDVAATFVSMGNPHAVIYHTNIEELPLERIGASLENHAAFPNRMNVHVVQVQSPSEVSMRTWERGTGITLACGTGASAVCVAGVLTGRSDRNVLIHLLGGDLQLEWRESDNHVYMTGPAVEVFAGDWPS